MLGIRKFKGRFGNQLLRYATLRTEAGDDYQCCPWVGRTLFGLDDPPFERGTESLTWFARNSSYYDLRQFRALFQPTPAMHERVYPMMEMLRDLGHTAIGLHLRRGDYGSFHRRSARWCFVSPTAWYLDWLRQNLSRFDSPVLVVASDDLPCVLPDFDDYPVFVPDRTIPEAPYYSDFYALTQCDVMLISNSTFGFTASMLNERATEFWRPRLSEERLIRYDPADAPVVFQDERY